MEIWGRGHNPAHTSIHVEKLFFFFLRYLLLYFMAMLGFGAARRLSRVAVLSLVAEYGLRARRIQSLVGELDPTCCY